VDLSKQSILATHPPPRHYLGHASFSLSSSDQLQTKVRVCLYIDVLACVV